MLSYLKTHGSAFEVGAALGRFGAQAVHEVLRPGAAWAEVMRWRGSPALRHMADLVQGLHPACWQELQGMASGLDLPWEDVFAWNCRGDVWAMAPDGCTTVQLPDETGPRFAHNEDGDPGLLGHCALAEVAVDGATRFAALVYPGSLPGHTIAVTDAGLAITVNNLRTLHAPAGLPRMVLTRALLDQPSIAAAVGLLKASPRSGGFHLTLGQAGDATLQSVEFNAALCSAHAVQRASLHANHMVHPAMANQPQIVTGSSGHRQIRGEALLAEADRHGRAPDPLAILFDQGHTAFPIFRDDPKDSDQENTLATALIEVGREAVHWQVHTRQSPTPLYRMVNGGPS
jgi:hypothetical protein